MSTIDWGSGYTVMPDDDEQQKPNGNGQATGEAAADPAWPVPAPAAFHGLAGDVVSSILPQTEADAAALLLHLLVYTGNIVGRAPYYLVEETRHYTNLYGLLAGRTAIARKGTAADRINAVTEIVDSEWAHTRMGGSISSGEGIINEVRDPIFKTKNGVQECTDPGVSDKRLMIDEREFFQALTTMQRQGNTISPVLRRAWDGVHRLKPMTKNSPIQATEAHISIMGHITIDEVRESLDHTSMANGFANRFLFACVKRSKLLPHGGRLDAPVKQRLSDALREVVTASQGLQRIEMTNYGKTRSIQS